MDNATERLFSTPWVTLRSSLLAPIHLSFRPFPVSALTCDFLANTVRRDLRLLGDIIPRCVALRALEMNFPQDILRVHSVDSSLPFSREQLNSALCHTISSMAQRTAGPVIVFSADTFAAWIYSCLPEDVRGWGLHLAQFELTRAQKLRSRARRILGLDDEAIPESSFNRSAHIRLHTGQTLKRGVQAPSGLFSVNILSSPSDTLSQSFTILIFNIHLITRLIIRSRYMAGPECLPTHYLDLAIVQIVLPSLREVILDDDGIDPTALGRFLFYNPTIETLEYESRSDDLLPRPAVDPPLVHPGLTTLDLRVNGKACTGRLIPALIHSPNLHTFRFSMMPDFLSPTNLLGFGSDLRNISLRNNDIHVHINLYCGTFPASEFFEIAGTLHCIRSVEVHGDLAECLFILPWLALLPAVLAVHFTVTLNHYFQPRLPDELAANELAAFTVSARTALGPGPELTVEKFVSRFL
ncbi:hypothetical protein DFH06DRAFT_1205594 [Mycena polygramma]|nr:hypothetical protein DFH06DRAFT_1205594 [Mycena polygramma]